MFTSVKLHFYSSDDGKPERDERLNGSIYIRGIYVVVSLYVYLCVEISKLELEKEVHMCSEYKIDLNPPFAFLLYNNGML